MPNVHVRPVVSRIFAVASALLAAASRRRGEAHSATTSVCWQSGLPFREWPPTSLRVAVRIRSSDTAMRELLAVAQVCPTAMLLAGQLMLFWPIAIALGPGFVALYYDHDVKSFADQSMCEQTVSILEERARRAKELVSALSEAAWR
jgi:hypothetical protein